MGLQVLMFPVGSATEYAPATTVCRKRALALYTPAIPLHMCMAVGVCGGPQRVRPVE